ncbi:uncharacterized protein LOC109510390 isoform X2 [Hippocampus comes]|uniref:uncharacterized protein LOC109510390 isoform X2 n=1 Tax=Hippocampus comes TaxID=109280 RepID=UPI00094EF1ED|nr:PREDICTED: uncharacterized protein LOC109510390 isoform X2 [Hippocampus comes]
MTTDAIILARVKTNPTFHTEDNTADARAALRVDPLASLSADSESVMGKKLLSESARPPGQQPAHADPAHLGASLPPPDGCRKTPSAEPQKILLLPSAGGVVTSDGKPLDWGLNNLASFLKISPYTAATMYPFLDMAYKAALMARPSPFLYQHLAYPSWCQMSESGSPEDGLFYFPRYVPAHLSSHLEPDLRMYASSPAALSPRRSLRGHQQTSAFGASLRQDTRCSAFPFNECHLGKSSANSSHSTSTNGSSARDPVNELVPAFASVPLPVSTTADSWEISKMSTALSAQRCGFSPFPVGSRGSEPDPPKPTGSSREKSASPDRRTTEKSPSPARRSVDGKVHQLPLDLSAKKMKSSSNGFQAKSDFIAQLSYGPQTGDAQCLKEGLFPPPTRSAKSSEPPKVVNSLNLDQGAVGSPSSQRSPESFSSTKLGRQAPRVTDSHQDARTFSGKQMSPNFRGQDNRPNLSKPRQPDVELGSTSGAIRTDSFIPLGLGYSNSYLLPYSTADDASLQRTSVSGKGAGQRYPVLLGHGSGLTRTPTKQGLPHRDDSPGPLSPAATFADLKPPSKGQNRSQESRQKPSRTRKPDPERGGSGSQRPSNQPLKSFCKRFNSVSESVVGVDMPFEDVDETGGRRGVRAPASQPHPLRRRCSSPPPAPSKEISTEASLSPSPELPVQQTMHCARTSPEQFSKKKQIGAPNGCDSSARCERGESDGLDESDDEDRLDRSPSSHVDASRESSYVRCGTAQFLKGAAVGCSSQSDGPVFTRKTTTTCGDTPSRVPADGVNADTESCVSSNQREQNSSDDGRSIHLRHPEYGCAVGDRLGQAPLPVNNSRAIFRDGEKNSPDIVDAQVGEGKDTRISTPTESFSGSLDSQPKYETEESCVSQSSCPRQEQSKENQDDETAASPCDASGGEGGWLELCQQSEGRGGGPAPALRVDAQKDAQPSSICVTPEHHRANDLVGEDGCSSEKEEGHRGESQEAPPVTGVARCHCNKPSSMMDLGDLDPDMATNHERILGLETFHQSSVRLKRRRTQDNGAENPFDDDVTPEDMSKQKSCIELNGPCIKKPRLPDDDVKVRMASSPPGSPRGPRQMDSCNLWQSSHVAASCLQEKRQKLKENRRASSLLPLSSDDDDLGKPSGKHLCKTKHTSEAAEEADEERGDGEGGIVRVSSDSCSPPPQPSFAVEPAGETPLLHAARSGHEEAVLDCLQRRLCNINHRDNAGYCALHEACTRGWLTIVRHLVERGADVNCSAQDGTRPLHDAVENNHVEVVRFLLACGADPTLTSCSGRGPIDMTGSVAMETFLEEYLADLQGRPEGDSGICWDFYGSSVCEPSTEGGVYNILAHPPGPEEEEEYEEEETERRLGREEFEIELSDQPLLPCYTLQVSPATGPQNWLLLCDVLAHLQMTAHTFRRLFPHLEVFTIPEAEFYCQTSLSQPCAHPAQRASFRSGAKDWLHLVEATPEMSAMLGSSLEFVNEQEPPVVSNISSPRPAPPPSSLPCVPVLPSHAPVGGASQGQSQDCAPVTSVERKANASSCVTRNQETINMLEAKNNTGPSSKTDSVACEVQHLQNRITVSTHCGTEEHSQCGENTDVHMRNRNSQNEDSEGVPQVVGEALQKVSTRAIDQKCRSLRDLSGQTVKMDAAWRRHLANVRVHIRDLGMKFAGGRTPSNVMDYRKVVDKVTESKATQLKNQPGR